MAVNRDLGVRAFHHGKSCAGTVVAFLGPADLRILNLEYHRRGVRLLSNGAAGDQNGPLCLRQTSRQGQRCS
jgi:hypothetical protein